MCLTTTVDAPKFRKFKIPNGKGEKSSNGRNGIYRSTCHVDTLDKLPFILFEKIIAFLWPDTSNIEQVCRRFHAGTKKYYSEMKVLDLTAFLRPSICTRRMFLNRFGQLKTLLLPLVWFEMRTKKGRDLVDMRTGQVGGWEIRETGESNCANGLSTTRSMLLRNQKTLRNLQLVGESDQVSREMCRSLVEILAAVPLPNLRRLAIRMCSSMFTQKFWKNLSNIRTLSVPYSKALLSCPKSFTYIKSLELILIETLTVKALAKLLNKFQSLENLVIVCEDPDHFLIQCEHTLNDEEICRRKHPSRIRHRNLRSLTLLDVRSRLPPMALPRLENFHWALCSECTMNAVAHDFGSNVINTLKVRGEIPQSYGDRKRIENNAMMELEVHGFFLSSQDILASLPEAPKLRTIHLEIGEPSCEDRGLLNKKYSNLEKSNWRQHLG